VLAYLLWHHPGDGVEREVYERALERFHRSLAHSPPVGFRGSAVYRAGDLPWLAPQTGYEDWYLVDDFAALGVLNEAAVAHGHRTAHDEVAHRFGGAAGGLYGLLEGHVDLGAAPLVIWVSRPTPRPTPGPPPSSPLARPPGVEQGALGALLGDGMEPGHASLWRRALVLGPAPEFCLLAREPPAGVAPARLPKGWQARTSTREALFR
jgi:hypothetical protein